MAAELIGRAGHRMQRSCASSSGANPTLWRGISLREQSPRAAWAERSRRRAQERRRGGRRRPPLGGPIATQSSPILD
jgi:hypothetical protein